MFRNSHLLKTLQTAQKNQDLAKEYPCAPSQGLLSGTERS